EINDSTIIHREDQSGDKYLCAFFTADVEIENTRLREHLEQLLPAYMVPSYFIRLDEIPLTSNGKVDSDFLTRYDISTLNFTANYTPPRDEMEKQLVDIWAEVLGVKSSDFGIDADFFQMGGHSIKATVLVAMIHKGFDIKIPLSELFKNPTIAGLAKYMKQSSVEQYCPITPSELRTYYPLSSAQKRLFFFHRMEAGSINYNMPLVNILEGAIDNDSIETIFKRLILRHESLRTSFHLIDNEAFQKVHENEEITFSLEHYAAGQMERELPGTAFSGESAGCESMEHFKSTIQNTFIRPFDISRAPLLRAGLIKWEEEKHILMVDMHHIVSDGVSMEIMLREFLEYYSGRTLPGLAVQYKDYAVWQNRLLVSDEIKKQEGFWLKQFEGDIPLLDLPVDYDRPKVGDFEGARLEGIIQKDEVEQLKELAREKGATLNMVLLALFNILLLRSTGQEDIIVGVPVAGRRHYDLNRIIGMFVNILPLRNFPSFSKRVTDFIDEVTACSVKAYENQDYQLDTLIEKLNLQRIPGRQPLFDVYFEFHAGEEEAELQELVEAEGLKLQTFENMYTKSKFDLLFTADENAEGIRILFEYRVKLFKVETIRMMCRHFEKIVSEVVDNPEKKISELKISEKDSPDTLQREKEPEQNDDLDASFYF
ncbi:MAG: non-ribosomal peptide synthetase, partial [bacterium]|nr:non-ribosomal peptide synthetase [bacterium]